MTYGNMSTFTLRNELKSIGGCTPLNVCTHYFMMDSAYELIGLVSYYVHTLCSIRVQCLTKLKQNGAVQHFIA